MCSIPKCIILSPLMKQCFVTTGICINMMTHGYVIGINSVILSQLKKTQDIPINDEMGSWIAATVAFASIAGILTLPLIMDNYGRRTANIIKSIFTITGFITMSLSINISTLLISRFIQGLALGFGAILGPILIGELSSPKYRGLFLATMTFSMLSGNLVVHGLGYILSWRSVSWVCTIITVVALLIIIYSPESPSFLVTKGRYTECRKAFHWLRGFDEEDELEKLIKADIMSKEGKTINDQSQRLLVRVQSQISFVKSTVTKREFYKPIIIMIHLHVINLWSGVILFNTYNGDICDTIFGKGFDASMVILSIDSQIIVSSALSIIIIRKIRRKLILFTVISLNVTSYLLIAGYVYFKECQILASNPIIGILLLHLQTFTIALGNLPIPNVISGEIFPLEYRGLGSTISSLSFSLNMMIKIKTFPFLISNIGLHGAYCMYAGIVAYGLFVSILILPETKDKTLQEIENYFKGSSVILSDLKGFDLAVKLTNDDRSFYQFLRK